MSRNKDRLGGHTPEPAEAPQQPVEKAFDPLSDYNKAIGTLKKNNILNCCKLAIT